MSNDATNILSLYELANDFKDYMYAETDEEMADALAQITAGQIEAKVTNCVKAVRSIEALAKATKMEEEFFNAKRKALENKAERLKEYMKECLLNADIDKLDAGPFKVSVGLSPGAVIIDNMETIPPRFITYIPESYTVDKKSVATAIRAGEQVNGAHLEPSYILRIR